MSQYDPYYDPRYGRPAPVYPSSYVGKAFIAWILYYLGFGIGGLIANIVFLNQAKNEEFRLRARPQGKGCLQWLLWVHIILPIVLLCVFLIIVPILGGLMEYSY